MARSAPGVARGPGSRPAETGSAEDEVAADAGSRRGRFARMLGLHLTEGMDAADARAYRITNIVQLVMLALPTLLLPQVNFVEPPETRPLSNASYVLHLVLMGLARWLLFRRKQTASAVLSLAVINLHLAVLCASAADEPGYVGFLLMAILPMLMIRRERIILRWVLVVIPAILFLAHQFYYRALGGAGIHGPPKWVIAPDYLMPPLILIVAFFVLIVQQFTKAVDTAEAKLAEERDKADELLANILPVEIADELKERGRSEPRHFEATTVCFTDFVGFTGIAEQMSPTELVKELDLCFSYFDGLMDRHNLEKLKTIGDSYMFAGGLPAPNRTHAVDCVMAALEIRNFMEQMKRIKSEQGLPYWELRIGIHSGDLVAGVIGEKKFAYDVWSDTVNTASRCEASGVTGQINISAATFELVQDFFDCEHRGRIEAKNKGNIEMYLVRGIRVPLQRTDRPGVPNVEFDRLYRERLSW